MKSSAYKITISVAIILVVIGLYEFLRVFLQPLKDLRLAHIQLALIVLRPAGMMHMVVNLLGPIVMIISGILLALRARAGWWMASFTTVFFALMFGLAFLVSTIIPALRDMLWVPLSRPYADFGVRSAIFTGLFVVLTQRDVWSQYFGQENLSKGKVSKIVVLMIVSNGVLAALLYFQR